ncbi:hypothetical protein NPIL_69061, partial [Nephila pilipes]
MRSSVGAICGIVSKIKKICRLQKGFLNGDDIWAMINNKLLEFWQVAEDAIRVPNKSEVAIAIAWSRSSKISFTCGLRRFSSVSVREEEGSFCDMI